MTMKNLQNERLEELVGRALLKAADSLSFFVKKEVLMKEPKIRIGACHGELSQTMLEGPVLVLESGLRGEYAGKSYLIFTHENAANFLKLARPEQPDAGLEDEYSQALLLEMDNIVTAAVVTEMANALDLQLYGGIPILNEWEDLRKQDLCAGLEEASYLQVITHFQTKDEAVEAIFVWVLEDAFVARMQELKSVASSNILTE